MLSDEVLDNIQILKFLHDKCTSEKSIGMMQVYRVDELAKAIETILNFIEKQQKEIEELKEKNRTMNKRKLEYFNDYELKIIVSQYLGDLLKEIIKKDYISKKKLYKHIEILEKENCHENCIIKNIKKILEE